MIRLQQYLKLFGHMSRASVCRVKLYRDTLRKFH